MKYNSGEFSGIGDPGEPQETAVSCETVARTIVCFGHVQRIFVISNDIFLAVWIWMWRATTRNEFLGRKALCDRISLVYVCSQIITLSGDIAAWKTKTDCISKCPISTPLIPHEWHAWKVSRLHCSKTKLFRNDSNICAPNSPNSSPIATASAYRCNRRYVLFLHEMNLCKCTTLFALQS